MEVVNALGRRKRAIARVFVSEGTGKITINKRDLAEYFPSTILQYVVKQPLNKIGAAEKYDIKVNLCGGGFTGQSQALRLAIARALVKINAEDKAALRADTVERGDFAGQKPDPGTGPHPVVHRSDRRFRYCRTALYGGLHTGPVQHAGRLHSADRRELYHTRPGRGIRLKEQRARLGYGRTGHRIGVHAFSDGDRRSTGDARQRSDIRHEIHPWRRNAVVYPGSGSIHRTGLPAGAVQ